MTVSPTARLVLLLVLFWTVPVVLIATLASLERLKRFIPFLSKSPTVVIDY